MSFPPRVPSKVHGLLPHAFCARVAAIGLVVVCTTLIVFAMVLQRGESSGAVLPAKKLFGAGAVANNFFGQQKFDPAKIVGREKCKKCHEPEYQRWSATAHNQKAWEMLSRPKAAEFATALRVANPKGAGLCTDCHGTKHSGGVFQGVSCESCHGASGPQSSGWFAIHSDYGQGLEPKIENRSKETAAHRMERLKKCDALGMNGPEDVYRLAKNCYQCHSVPVERLVNAGHPGLNAEFEFVNWAQGEVRHNFMLSPDKNAEASTLWLAAKSGRTAQGHKRVMYVVGQLVELETSIRNRANATERGAYATATGQRASRAVRKLGSINRTARTPEVTAALAAARQIRRTLVRPPAAGQKKDLLTAADAVAKQAEKFAQRDGAKLAALDKMVPDTGRVSKK